MDWIAGWSKRIKLTVDHTKVASDLEDFPILVNLDSTCSGVFNELGDNSKRISFINPSTHEQYYCEIERWDSVNQSAQLWVKLPTVASGINTELYMLYDNNNTDNTNYIGETTSSTAQNVWDTSFVAVYHMSQDPSVGGACTLDSTNNIKHGTPYNMISGNVVSCSVGKALYFDGINNSVDLGITGTDISDPVTFEAFSKPVSNEEALLLDCQVNGSIWASYIFNITVNGNPAFYYKYANSSGNDHAVSHNEVIDGSSFAYIAGTHGGGLLSITYNDSKVSVVGTETANSPSSVYTVGEMQSGYSYKEHTTREIRISDSIRSDSWLKTTRYSNEDTLLIKSTEEIQPTNELDYQNKIQLIIPHDSIDNSLYNFPILLNLSSSSGYNNEDITDIFIELETTNNRKKIAVTDYTGTAQCFVEIENWSHAEHSAQLWVKVPEISSIVDTILYLYYDISKENNNLFIGETNSLPAQNVWDENFAAVYHMNQDPTGGILTDSTLNNNHADAIGSNMTSNNLVDGCIGKSIYFNKEDTSYKVVNPSSIKTSTFTLSAIIDGSMDSSVEHTRILNYGPDGENHGGFIFGQQSDGLLRAFVEDSTTWRELNSIKNVGDNKTHYICYTYNEGTTYQKLYIDGELDTQTNASNSCNSPENATLSIGYSLWGTEYHLGALDEIRIYSTEKPDYYISTTYKSNTDNLIIYIPQEQQVDWLETYESGSLSPWAKRIKLEIDNTKVDEYLEDFPVLINLCSSSGYSNTDTSEVLNHLLANKYKLAVTSSDGITQLPVEIELWDQPNESTQLWTKIPLVYTDSTTLLYLYYDVNKSDNLDYIGETGSSVAQSVWDNNFNAVYHMVQTPVANAPCILDSTRNLYHGTPDNTTPIENSVDGLIGKALYFDGDSNYINIGNIFTPVNNTITLEMICSAPLNAADTHRVLISDSYPNEVESRIEVTDTSIIYGYHGPGWNDRTFETGSIYNDSFRHITSTYDGSSVNLYLDDTRYTEDFIGTIPTENTDWYIGRRWDTAQSNFWKGTIEEVRISNITRSGAWIKTTKTSNTDDLILYGTEENCTSPLEDPNYFYHGYIKEKTQPAERKIFLYDRVNGNLIDSSISDEAGYYLLETGSNEEHFIVVMDDDAGEVYDPIIQDRILPNGE